MRHKLTIWLTLTVALLTLWGCAAGPKSGSTEETTSDTPEWWFNPGVSETHFYAFGQAKKQNPSLAQKVAQQRARDDISNQVKSSVQNEIRDYMQESGLGETAQALEFSENTTVAISDNVLQGAVSDKYFKGKDGTVYIRVSYPKDGVDKALLNAAKKEEALYNEFKATQAFGRLEQKVSGN